MKQTNWQPTNEPGRYDRARVATLQPVRQAIERLPLPPIRLRKLLGICNALEMQIEDGGDHPDVDDHLLEALRLAVVHQAGRRQAKAVLRAIDRFARGEEKRWRQVRAGTLPPPRPEPDEKLDELMQAGYALLSEGETAAACDQWLLAWEQVKEMATPAMRTIADFEGVYPPITQTLFNWTQDLEMKLYTAGHSDPIYHEHRLRYAREYLAQFPDAKAEFQVSFRVAEAEALWALSRIDEAEKVYETLIATYPDNAWPYISWSDQCRRGQAGEAGYERAKAILRRALARPDLDERHAVQDRVALVAARQREEK